jgi:hypothetical protein
MKKFVSILALILCFIVLMSACEESSEQSPSSSQSSGSSSGGQQSPGASQSAAQPIQPKQLISKDDAVKLLGESVKEGIESKDLYQGLSGCFYAPEKADSKSYLMIVVLQKEQSSGGQGGGQQGSGQQGGQSGGGQQGGQSGGSQQGAVSPKKVFEILKKVFSDPNMPVSGFIGDDKFIMSQGMCILSGENCIYIAVGNSDPAKAQPILKQAAELAVSNLSRIQGK